RFCPIPTRSWTQSETWRRIEIAIEVAMPQMGESVVEGTITKWLVKEGDLVSEDQPLFDISTEKVDIDIPSPAAGRVATIVAREGETRPFGGRLAVIEDSGAAAGPKTPEVSPAPAAQPKAEPQTAPVIREVRAKAPPAA